MFTLITSQSMTDTAHNMSPQATLQDGASSSSFPAKHVDVDAILDKAVAAQSQKLAWRTSIVDLMKALKLDSSLGARKKLAARLMYDGDTNNTWEMNTWLHKQIKKKLAENGGEVPEDLQA